MEARAKPFAVAEKMIAHLQKPLEDVALQRDPVLQSSISIPRDPNAATQAHLAGAHVAEAALVLGAASLRLASQAAGQLMGSFTDWCVSGKGE